MKKPLFIILVSLLLISGCKCKKDADKLPDPSIQDKISLYAPLASFKEVYRNLETTPASSFAPTVSKQIFSSDDQLSSLAFAYGVVSADAYWAFKARNKIQLSACITEMLRLAPSFEAKLNTKILAADYKKLSDKDNWKEMEGFLDGLKKSIEDELWAKNQHELYTLLVLGSWAQTLDKVSELLLEDYSAKATQTLNHIGPINSIAGNFEMFPPDGIRKSPLYAQLAPEVQKMRDVINTDTDRTYTQAQLTELREAVQNIKKSFEK